MKRYILFLTLLFSMCVIAQAQTPDDVRVIDIELVVTENTVINVIAEENYLLHNEIILNATITGSYLGSIKCKPAGLSEFDVHTGLNAPFTIPASNQTQTKTIEFWITGPNGQTLAYPFQVTLQPTFTPGNAGMLAPDEVWDISTSAAWSPPAGVNYQNPIFNGSAVSGGTAYLKISPLNGGKLKKPIIFVDGIDFNTDVYTYNGQIIRHGTTGWDVLVLGNYAGGPSIEPGDSELKLYPQAFNTLLNEGYDIFFLDFANGVDYIQKNGLTLVKLIEMVNERRAHDDPEEASKCKNAVVGASMGGQVAKWALTYMENNNMPHMTHTYVSFDSPHQGAHIPLGVQAMSYFFGQVQQDDDFWNRLNSPAARQLLIESLDQNINSEKVEFEYFDRQVVLNQQNEPVITDIPITYQSLSSTGLEELHQNFQQDIGAGGYPQRTRNVAVSCGTALGEPIPAISGGRYFQSTFEIEYQGVNLAHGFSTTCDYTNGGNESIINLIQGYEVPPVPIALDVLFESVPLKDRTIFLGAAPTDLVALTPQKDIPSRYGIMRLRTKPEHPFALLDNAPGCKRGDLYTIQEKIAEASGDITFPVNAGYTTFMPTLSLLDVDLPMTTANLFATLPINDEQWVHDHTPFEAVYAPETNLRHIEITTGMVQFLLDQLEIGYQEKNLDELVLHAGETYNYGNVKKIVPDAEIQSGARLAVNLTGNINYMTPNDPPANKPFFEVYTQNGCSQGSIVTVDEGGVLQIGDPEASPKSGKFHLLKHSTIHVKDGGTLRISNASQLHVYEGATLILDAGARVLLDDPLSQLSIEGKWVINGDFHFAGLGYIVYKGEIEFGPDATRFRLIGQVPLYRNLILRKDLVLPAGINLLLRSTGVETAGGSIKMTGTSTAECSSVLFTGGNTGINALGDGDINLAGCAFNDIYQPFEFLSDAEFSYSGTKKVTIAGCSFTNFQKGAWVKEKDEVRFTSCSFFLADGVVSDRDFAWFSDKNDNVIFRNSYITGVKKSDGALTSANEVMTATDMGEGIRVNGGFSFWMDGGKIESCDIAIGNRSVNATLTRPHDPANLLFSNMAAIKDCIAGVSMEGNKKSGLVIASCSQFIDNKYGISGQDITLLIDPSLLNPTPQYEPLPNIFVRDGIWGANDTRYIDICFIEKTPGNPLMVRNNFWGVHDLLGNIVTANPAQIEGGCELRKVNPGESCFIAPNVNVAYEPRHHSMRTCNDGLEECAGESGDCLSDCDMPVASEIETSVRAQFMTGYEKIMAESYTEAANEFSPVSAIWSDKLQESMTTQCASFVEAATSFIETEEQGRLVERQRFETNQQQNGFTIQPNPATARVTLHFQSENTTIVIVDALGREKYRGNIEQNSILIDTQNWPSGSYFVTVMDNNNGAVEQKILAIVR